MGYFGSVFFKMPNNLVAGYKTVFDDGKIIKGKLNPSFDRRAELSFIPLQNIKDIYVACDNHRGFNTTEEYNTTKINDFTYQELNAYCKVKRNSTIFTTYDNKVYGWGNNEDGQLGLPSSVEFADELTELSFYFLSAKKIIRSKTSSDVFNGTYLIMPSGQVKGCGYGLYKYASARYEILDIKQTIDNSEMDMYCNDIFITKDRVYFVTDDKVMYYTKEDYFNLKTLEGVNPNGLVNIVDWYENPSSYIYSNNMLGNATTLFIYKNGQVLARGSSFDVVNKEGVKVKLFDGDSFNMSPVKCNINGIKKIENEIILYNNGNTNIGIEDIQDFNTYLTPKNRVVYYKTFDDKIHCKIYNLGNEDSSVFNNRTLNFYTIRDNVTFSTSINDINVNIYNVENWTILNNRLYDFEIELYKNREELICNIPKEYIESIPYKFGLDVDSFELKIPKYVGQEKRLNPIYDKIKSRHQLVITDIKGVKTRYILKEQKVRSTYFNGDKTFTAYSGECTVLSKRYSLLKGTYQLYKDDIHTENGVLNNIINNTGYNVGCIDYNSRFETLTQMETKTLNRIQPSSVYKTPIGNEYIDKFNCVKYDVRYGDTLFHYWYKSNTITNNGDTYGNDDTIQAITTTSGQQPLYLSLAFNNIVVGDLDNGAITSNNVEYGDIYIDFDEVFYSKITSIKAECVNIIGHRNSLKFTIYMADNTSIEIIKDFVKCANDVGVNTGKQYGKYITWDSVDITYTTGNMVKGNNLVCLNFDEQDGNVDSILTEITNLFNCTISFDNMNNFIHIFNNGVLNLEMNNYYSIGNNKVENNIELTYDDLCEINSDDIDEDIISGIKVVCKDDVNLASVNPLGGNIIENWDYFINNKLLSDHCIQSLNNYKTIMTNKETEWTNLESSYTEVNNVLITKQAELTSINEAIKGLNYLLQGYVDGGDSSNVSVVSTQIKDKLSTRDTLEVEVQTLQANSDKLLESITLYSTSNSKDNIIDSNKNNVFTYEDLCELYDFESIQEVNDDYFTNATQSYEYHTELLAQKVKGRVEFSTKSNDMIRFYKIIKLGSVYELCTELKNIYNEERVRLIGYTYYPNKGNKGSIENLLFSNQENIINKRKFFAKNSKILPIKNSQSISRLSSTTSTTTSEVTAKASEMSLVEVQAKSNMGSSIGFRINEIIKGSFALSKIFNAQENIISMSSTYTSPPIFDIYFETEIGWVKNEIRNTSLNFDVYYDGIIKQECTKVTPTTSNIKINYTRSPRLFAQDKVSDKTIYYMIVVYGGGTLSH